MNKKDNLINYYIPTLGLIIAFLSDQYSIAIGIVLLASITIKKSFLLTFLVSITFFNFVHLENSPSWGGLIPSILIPFIIYTRLLYGSFNKRMAVGIVYLLFITSLLVIYFYWKSFGAMHQKTAIKSVVQYLVLMLNIFFILNIRKKDREVFMLNFSNCFPTFILLYLSIYLGTNGLSEKLRLDGFIGAQALGLSLAIIITYLIFNRKFKTTIIVLFFQILTGSRTYTGLSLLIIFLAVFADKQFKKVRLLIIPIAVIFIITLPTVLPLLTNRFVLDEKFLGTLLARFQFYEVAYEMIKSNPLIGNGFGSIVYVLKYWAIEENYIYYLVNGDTTTVHNEYLRILIETGFIGFFLVATSIIYLSRKVNSKIAKYYLYIVLIGSLVENTISLYSTSMFLFVILFLLSIDNRPSGRLNDIIDR